MFLKRFRLQTHKNKGKFKKGLNSLFVEYSSVIKLLVLDFRTLPDSPPDSEPYSPPDGHPNAHQTNMANGHQQNVANGHPANIPNGHPVNMANGLPSSLQNGTQDTHLGKCGFMPHLFYKFVCFRHNLL